MSDDDGSAEQFLRALNDAWTRGAMAELADCFSDDAILAIPGERAVVRGAAAITNTYRQFLDAAEVKAFSIDAIEVFPANQVEVCHLDFQIHYVLNGVEQQDHGRDIYVLSQAEDGSRKVLWRTQHPLSDATS